MSVSSTYCIADESLSRLSLPTLATLNPLIQPFVLTVLTMFFRPSIASKHRKGEGDPRTLLSSKESSSPLTFHEISLNCIKHFADSFFLLLCCYPPVVVVPGLLHAPEILPPTASQLSSNFAVPIGIFVSLSPVMLIEIYVARTLQNVIWVLHLEPPNSQLQHLSLELPVPFALLQTLCLSPLDFLDYLSPPSLFWIPPHLRQLLLPLFIAPLHVSLHCVLFIKAIQTLLSNLSKDVGSPVKIGSFLRMEVGEGLQGLEASTETEPLANAA
ncbi:Elongation factor Ts, mitochondrial [Capsicum baccatum]|uniref:Elongation factor Ts, mitochondrial n=1 Tax=Capsicum baccatum TaxID=33114 RepID=A0A2G2X4L4_CAPBA|nr:Elongation factor Ts, mitochondrial [Capsicum baccatum]